MGDLLITGKGPVHVYLAYRYARGYRLPFIIIFLLKRIIKIGNSGI
jgi:hypothetical protein